MELESTRTFSDELTAALTSGDESKAARAALSLGRTEDPRAAGYLKNATGSRSVPVRALAVYAYGLLAAKGGVTTEVPLRALRDAHAAVRIAGIDAAWREQAAGVRGALTFVPRLAQALHDPEPIVRARAATALSGWKDAAGDVDATLALRRAYAAERDPVVRWHEAWALRRAFAMLTPLQTIKSGLRDPDETVRIQFADLVARRKHAADASILEPLLADRSWRVREQAYESIKVLAGGERTEHLTAIPAAIVTPAPVPENTESPLPRASGLAPARKPVAADAILDRALLPRTAALMDGPLPGAHPRVRIGTTKGTLVLRLYPEWAPLTVANFLNLTERGYFDGLRWFRIVPDFVTQTGDPHDNGEGDAGYTIPAEENPLEQRAGVISMGLNYSEGAHPGPIRDSAGTQFYITISPQLHLDRDFTVFGEVESGFPVLGRLIESDRMTKVERLADG